MPNELTYLDFRGLIPQALDSPGYAKAQLGIYDGNADFIAPLIRRLDVEQERPAVILISAPAAVGKSYLARQLSRDNHAVYWNLADFSLGSNFFVGTAVQQYGPEGYSKFVKELKSGKRALILDAADEALVRAGRANYIAALENLADMIRGAEASSVVILGREETIADTAAALQEQGVAASNFAVAFFAEQEARLFVKSKAEFRGARIIREFDDFMDVFFASVEQALGASSWEDARTFLGYAPVLDAVATFYSRQSNPIRVLESIKKSADDGYLWNILTGIFEDVLYREQEKFGNTFGGGDDRKIKFAESAFTVRAQMSYLLSESLAPSAFEFDENGEPEWFSDLEDHLRLQLKEHPFRFTGARLEHPNPLLRFSNTAFRDYVLVRAVGDPELIHPDVLRSYWRDPAINPTPIFSGLLFTMSSRLHPLLPSIALGMIHDSHASLSSEKTGMLFTSADSDGDNRPDILTVMRWLGADAKAEFVLIDALDRLPTFDRMLSNAFVDLEDFEIRLGDGFADFLLGPQAVVATAKLSSLVPEVRVRSQKGLGAILSLDSVGGMTRSIAASPLSALAIMQKSGSLPYPWQRYVVDGGDVAVDGVGANFDEAMSLRRLFGWFSKQSSLGGGLRYPVNATDALIAKNRISASLFEYLSIQGYVAKSRGEYVLTLPVASRSIYQNDTQDPAYVALLQGYAEWSRPSGA